MKIKKSSLVRLLLIATVSFTHLSFAFSPYFSGQVGRFAAGESNLDLDRGIGARIAMGGNWDLSPRMKPGLEVGLVSMKHENARTGIDLLGVLDFYATQKFDLFAKAGWGYHAKCTGPKVGLGFGYSITPRWNVNLELASHFYGNSSNERLEGTGTAMIGLKYFL